MNSFGNYFNWQFSLELLKKLAVAVSVPAKGTRTRSGISAFSRPLSLSVTFKGRRMNGHGQTGNGDGAGGRGALIVLEGCDKAGKSTQCRLLVEALNKSGRKSHLFTFPDRTTDIGKMIDQYLKCSKSLSDEAIHLLFSSNRWELMPTIKDLLHKGESVVLDRYAFSGVAFSAAKGTLDLEWCKAPDVGLPQPDTVFFLNVSEDVASSRGDYGEERYEKAEFQVKVKNVFLQIQDPAYWKILDENRTPEEVHDDLLKFSSEVIDSSHDKPILPLWRCDKSHKKEKETISAVTIKELWAPFFRKCIY